MSNNILSAPFLDGNPNPLPSSGIVGGYLFVWNGASWDRVREPSSWKDVNNVNINAAANLWTPTAGKTVRLMGGDIFSDTTGVLLFQDDSSNVIFRLGVLANVPKAFDLGNGRLLTAGANAKLQAVLASAHLSGTLYGTEE